MAYTANYREEHMSYPYPFAKLTWGGTIRDEDIWSNSTSWDMNQDPAFNLQWFNAVNLQTVFATIQAAYVGSTGMNSFNTLSFVKLALLDQEGKYVTDARLYEPANPVSGANNTATHAPQDTFVVSLLTATKRGIANRGRIYPPSGFYPVDATGLLTEANRTAYLTKFKTMFNALQTNLSNEYAAANLVVASKQKEGAIRAVTKLAVGNLLDAQNRRRNKLKEIYTETTL